MRHILSTKFRRRHADVNLALLIEVDLDEYLCGWENS